MERIDSADSEYKRAVRLSCRLYTLAAHIIT
jgi:hypothetical protein